jgi:hypothetical protein
MSRPQGFSARVTAAMSSRGGASLHKRPPSNSNPLARSLVQAAVTGTRRAIRNNLALWLDNSGFRPE